jgi:hypothetical protein
MAAPLNTCTTTEQRGIVCVFLWAKKYGCSKGYPQRNAVHMGTHSLKSINISYSEYMSIATGVQYVLRTRNWPVRVYYSFSTFSHKQHDFLNTRCVFWPSVRILYKTFVILRGSERDMIISVYWSASEVTVTLLLSVFNETWIFATDFQKIRKYKIS